jgi:uncharacterized protein
VIYFDTSALLKLVHSEAETATLVSFVRDHPASAHICSEITRAELVRAINRLNHDDQGELLDRRRYEQEIGELAEVLQEVNTVAVSSAILTSAAGLVDPFLRTLDAIHLATARRLGAELRAFVTYDRRLAGCATKAGLPVATPA